MYTNNIICVIVLAPIPNALVKRIRKYPNMHDEDYAQKRFGQSASMAPLVLPYVQGESNRVIYQITEYIPLLDSSNMTMHDWARIATDIYVSKYTNTSDVKKKHFYISIEFLSSFSNRMNFLTALWFYMVPIRYPIPLRLYPSC